MQQKIFFCSLDSLFHTLLSSDMITHNSRFYRWKLLWGLQQWRTSCFCLSWSKGGCVNFCNGPSAGIRAAFPPWLSQQAVLSNWSRIPHTCDIWGGFNFFNVQEPTHFSAGPWNSICQSPAGVMNTAVTEMTESSWPESTVWPTLWF